MWLTTAEQMRAADRKAMAMGLPGLALMEAAAAAAARAAQKMIVPGGRVVVVAGGGNNGGDGWGAARHLAARGMRVQVISSADPNSLAGAALSQFQACTASGVKWELWQGSLPEADLVVDALLGTGTEGAPRPPADELIGAINQHQAPVLAVDIPSGLPADGQPPSGPVVKAATTVTFGLAKVGLYSSGGRTHAGTVIVDPIGLPPSLMKDTGIFLNTREQAAAALPKRCSDSHKGTYGHGLLVAGSRGMSGAAMLAGEAALRSGAGLLTIACPQGINPVVEGGLWEALTLPLPETDQGTLAAAAADALTPLRGKFTAAAVGPGLGNNGDVRPCIELLLASDLPLAVDADGLNLLAPGIPTRSAPLVISPHPGEMARLLGNTSGEVLADPLVIARGAAREWQCVVVLKEASTWVASPAGPVAVNVTGTDGLATGGSGDCLTGLVLGLLAQGSDAFAAACAATWLLGRASELAAACLGTAGQMPRDVLKYIPRALVELAGDSA